MEISSLNVVETVFKKWKKCPEVSSMYQMSEKDKRIVKEVIEALDSSDWRAVQLIRLYWPNPNLLSNRGFTLLQEAAIRGCLHATKELLKRKPGVNIKNDLGQTALFLAARTNNGDVILELAAAGGDPNVECSKTSPLHLAASLGHEKTVWALLKVGASPYIPDTRGDYPIHVAIRGAIPMLLEVCPQLMLKKTVVGNTALHCAAWRGNAEDLKTLIDLEADLDVCNFIGETPLASAARGRSVECARLLLRNGAKVNERIRKAQTPLHIAVLFGHTEMAVFLLSKGADLTATAADLREGPKGKLITPGQLAEEQGHIFLAKILKQHQ